MAKKGFFNTLASAFVDVQEDEAQQSPVVNQPIISESIGAGNVAAPVQSQAEVHQATAGEYKPTLDKQLFEQLCAVIEEANLPGPDYVELMKAANDPNMVKAIADEGTRFLSAFVGLKAMSPEFTKKIVLDSIDEYVKILTSEQQRGLTEWQKKWDDSVTAQENGVAEARKEIERLERELSEKRNFISEREASLVGIKTQLNKGKENFNDTFSHLLNKLETDKAKINEVLPA